MAADSDRLAFFLLKGVNKVIREHNLIEHGDRIAVALSGGKDSTALMRLLNVRRSSVPQDYHLVGVHVAAAPDAPCASPDGTDALEAWLAREGISLHRTKMEPARREPARADMSPCFHCSWRRRKALFTAADDLGCNKVALGHHADDIAQTTLLNLFYQARLETMLPRQSFFGDKLIVIRPLAYTDEKELVRFAAASDFPQPPPPCPQASQSRRALVAELLRTVERDNPKVKILLWRAVQRCAQALPSQGDLADD
jgi:tRNA(Ile)-lysidine synthase TilS/MesJ